jgi:hypothetical protein
MMFDVNSIVKYKDMIGGLKIASYGRFSRILIVSWDDAPVTMVPWRFETIGLREIPVLDDTPRLGFRMVDHPEWIKLKNQILQGYEKASFENLDLINIDLEALARISRWNVSDNWNPLWGERQDWAECSTLF